MAVESQTHFLGRRKGLHICSLFLARGTSPRLDINDSHPAADSEIMRDSDTIL